MIGARSSDQPLVPFVSCRLGRGSAGSATILGCLISSPAAFSYTQSNACSPVAGQIREPGFRASSVTAGTEERHHAFNWDRLADATRLSHASCSVTLCVYLVQVQASDQFNLLVCPLMGQE